MTVSISNHRSARVIAGAGETSAGLEYGLVFLAVAASQVQGLLDVIALDFVEGAANQAGRTGRVIIGGKRDSQAVSLLNVVQIQLAVVVLDDHAFDQVAQFPNVAGPVVSG